MKNLTAADIFSYGETAVRGHDTVIVYPKQNDDLWFEQHFEDDKLDALRKMVKSSDAFRIDIIPESRIVFSFLHSGEGENVICVSNAVQKQKTKAEIEIERQDFLNSERGQQARERLNKFFEGVDFDNPFEVQERFSEWIEQNTCPLNITEDELQAKTNEWNALKFFVLDFYIHHPIGEIEITDFNKENGIGYAEISILVDKPTTISLKGKSKLRFERMLDACNSFLFEGNSSRKVDSCLNLTASLG